MYALCDYVMACPVDRGSGPWTWRRGPGRVGGAERSAGERQGDRAGIYFSAGARRVCACVCVLGDCVCALSACVCLVWLVCLSACACVRVRALLIVVSLSRLAPAWYASRHCMGELRRRRGGVAAWVSAAMCMLGGVVWCGRVCMRLVYGNAYICVCVRVCVCVCVSKCDILCMVYVCVGLSLWCAVLSPTLYVFSIWRHVIVSRLFSLVHLPERRRITYDNLVISLSLLSFTHRGCHCHGMRSV